MNARTTQLLDLYTDYLLVSFGQTTATGLAALVPDLSHDQVTRFLAKQELTDKDLWKIVKPHLRKVQSDDAVLIIDDTVQEKLYTDESELVCWHFDHTKNRTVKGINLLSALYFSQNTALPVAFQLIQKTQLTTDTKTGKDKWESPKTKNEYLRVHTLVNNMVQAMRAKQVPYRYVLADTWFSAADNLVFIKETAKKDFLMPLKSNRKVALSLEEKHRGHWTPISSLAFETDTPTTIYLERILFPLLVLRQVFTNEDGSTGVLYLVTSDLSLSASAMTSLYQTRWKIEEYHKSLKSLAAFAKSPTKRPRTQANHFFASLVAFVKLETYRKATHLNHFALKGKLYLAALRSALEELQILKIAHPQASITI